MSWRISTANWSGVIAEESLSTRPFGQFDVFLKNCFRAFLDNPPEYSDEKWSGEEDDLNSRFEFENDHYKRSMSFLSKVPDIIKEYEEEKGKDITYNKTSDNDKERLLKLIFYHKVREF